VTLGRACRWFALLPVHFRGCSYAVLIDWSSLVLTCCTMSRADLDHTNDKLRKSLKDWMRWLKTELGFDSFRFDFAKVPRQPRCRHRQPLL